MASDVTLMCIAARRNGCTGETAVSGAAQVCGEQCKRLQPFRKACTRVKRGVLPLQHLPANCLTLQCFADQLLPDMGPSFTEIKVTAVSVPFMSQLASGRKNPMQAWQAPPGASRP